MIILLSLALLFQASPPPAAVSVDLDGDGTAERVSAALHGKKVRVEVLDAAGAKRARVDAPAPESGAREIALASGSLGSAGALLEVMALAPDRECRTLWRLRNRELSPVPIQGPNGKLPDCSSPEGWTDRWEKPQEDAPANYVRERTRATEQGAHHRKEVYRFSGFELTLDPARSTADIDGLLIPDWTSLNLYPRPLIENLLSGFDLSNFKTTTRLRILADRDAGIFAIEVARPTGIIRLPIRQGQWDAQREEWSLIAVEGERSTRVHLRLTADQHHPLELTIEGSKDDLNHTFVPVSRRAPEGIELFASAEEELALRALAGDWDSNRGERISITSVSAGSTVIDFGKLRASLDIGQAPQGSDVLLMPHDGSSPKIALALRGPDVFARVPVQCAQLSSIRPGGCRVSGTAESFRRVGSQINAR